MIYSSRTVPNEATEARRAHASARRGFTLIELLVVILIILLVSAVALPVVLPALSHRQVSEAARMLQAALAGARDSALKNGTPSGIRLLPDPAFPLIYNPATGQIDPTQPFAANRIIPIESAPEYTEGMLSVQLDTGFVLNIPYPAINGGPGFNYPFGMGNNIVTANGHQVLMVKEQVLYADKNNPQQTDINSPTSWFWNIRVGDKLQINGTGLWYTVVGPMVVPPQGATINGVFMGNSESFVNAGAPGTQSPFSDLQGPNNTTVYPEFLFLVNGLDDNNNGWIDEDYDGVDNNFCTSNQNNATHYADEIAEWEQEAWPASFIGQGVPANLPYTIQRRPAPVSNSREISLPTNVVIDLTTWGNPALGLGSQERSQIPLGVINSFTGYVDVLLYPNGTVVPTTQYSTPSSFGMSSAFFHFWLAERADVAAPTATATQQHYLPIGNIVQTQANGVPYGGPTLKGEYRIVTLFTRTGQITSNDDPQFDNPANPVNGPNTYNPLYPFLPTQQGTKGGR